MKLIGLFDDAVMICIPDMEYIKESARKAGKWFIDSRIQVYKDTLKFNELVSTGFKNTVDKIKSTKVEEVVIEEKPVEEVIIEEKPVEKIPKVVVNDEDVIKPSFTVLEDEETVAQSRKRKASTKKTKTNNK